MTKADCYVERHHVIPKSEGGSNNPDNLVNLTAREHYVAHLLLAKIYDDFKMLAAVKYMQTRHNESRKFKFNSRLYAALRKRFAWKISEAYAGEKGYWFGRRHSAEARQKMSDAKRGKPTWSKGKAMSDEQKKKLSKALRGEKNYWFGKHPSEETLRKRSEAMQGRKNPNYGKHWWNDAITEIFCYECPEGFIPGRLKKS